MKRCIICLKEKQLSDFYAHPQMKDGHLNKCKECCREYARRKDSRASDIDRYRHNPKRYLKHKYYGIKTRCEGRGSNKSYAGRAFLTMEEWEVFCEKTHSQFMVLYKRWQDSGYDRWLSPSIDRIDNDGGYTVDNIQWLTMADNGGKYRKEMVRRIAVSKDGETIGVFPTQQSAADAIGAPQANVGRALRQGKRKNGMPRLVNGYSLRYVG